MSEPHWATNLRTLCATYPSISEVCRRLAINRQQFNKYLSGQVRPSRYNLRRIAEFFAVDPADLELPPPSFAARMAGRRTGAAACADSPALEVYADLVRRSRGELDRYVGYYLRSFYAFSYPGQVIVSLAALVRRGDEYLWKTVELGLPPRPGARRTVMKYTGTALFLGDRIYVLEHEALLRSSVTQLILYPSYQNPITVMTGVHTGAPTMRGRKPTASTVLLQYLGAAPDLRRALRQCGIFPEDAVDPEIRRRIRNEVGGDRYVLEAEQV